MKKLRKSASCGFLLAVISVFFALNVTGCREEEDSDIRSKRVEDTIEEQMSEDGSLKYKQEVQNFRLDGFSKTGESQWSVQGQFANIVDPDIILQSIKGMSISDELSVSLSADGGVYNKDTKSATLEGNVIIILSDGGRVTMDYAVWNASDEEILTDSPLKIEHEGITLDGIGGKVKPQIKWALIKKNIKLADKNGRVITCDGPMEVDYNDRKAILYNNVEIIDKEGKMYADKVIAFFDPDKKSIEKVEWLGNVKAVY